jgi:hypothetical protein
VEKFVEKNKAFLALFLAGEPLFWVARSHAPLRSAEAQPKQEICNE